MHARPIKAAPTHAATCLHEAVPHGGHALRPRHLQKQAAPRPECARPSRIRQLLGQEVAAPGTQRDHHAVRSTHTAYQCRLERGVWWLGTAHILTMPAAVSTASQPTLCKSALPRHTHPATPRSPARRGGHALHPARRPGHQLCRRLVEQCTEAWAMRLAGPQQRRRGGLAIDLAVGWHQQA